MNWKVTVTLRSGRSLSMPFPDHQSAKIALGGALSPVNNTRFCILTREGEGAPIFATAIEDMESVDLVPYEEPD